jgi:chromatin modification-related protein VID21
MKRVIPLKKWMATDFRQERRWKTVAAYHMAQEVQEWHMSTPEEREAMRSKYYRSLDKDVPAGGTKEEFAPGTEQDVRDSSAQGMIVGTSRDAMDVDAEGEAEEESGQGAEKATTQGGEEAKARSTSVTPQTGTSQPTQSSSDTVLRPTPAEAPVQQPQGTFQNLVAVREPIFALTPNDFVVDPTHHPSIAHPSNPHLFHTYLPDLPLYEPPAVPAESKADKRFDESTPHHSRLSHQTHLLDSKPLLLSTLQPGRKRGRDGEWRDMSDITTDDARESLELRQDTPPVGCGTFKPLHHSNRNIS